MFGAPNTARNTNAISRPLARLNRPLTVITRGMGDPPRPCRGNNIV